MKKCILAYLYLSKYQDVLLIIEKTDISRFILSFIVLILPMNNVYIIIIRVTSVMLLITKYKIKITVSPFEALSTPSWKTTSLIHFRRGRKRRKSMLNKL